MDKKVRPWRTAIPVRVVTVAMLVGGMTAGVFVDSNASPNQTAEGTDNTAAPTEVTPYTEADTGDCVTWDFDKEDAVANFRTVSCDRPHRFEVAARLDLAAYPASEFGPEAEPPNQTRLAELRRELCQAPTLSYLGGRLDVAGRFTIAPILPPSDAWSNGDRTLLCGIQAPDASGKATETTGDAHTQDQARVLKAGQCLVVDERGAMSEVDCKEDHIMEVTSAIDLGQTFKNTTPSVEKQNDYLAKNCTAAAEEYLGNEEALYQSTLIPFWTTIGAESWENGARSVNCYLIKDDGKGGFSTLKGSAKDKFTINGKPPAKQPERPPLRGEDEEPQSGAGPNGGQPGQAPGGADGGGADGAPVAGQ
ncbi:septum formation family protein [Corynebacterium ulceribovis]|uniref:septum formation family protein n=1 Tax=Corynebacterium ulceribovis TaxID=487732 RepID=UPI0003779CB3|nr:septum formation family protein [Corynebacterium ulceribovis]